MTFLNPLALFGLFAAAIPVLLHILTLRRLQTIEFSTLRFLKELQRTRIRRLKVRQLLLLILRTLLVVLIVLAFSRPTVRGALGTGPGSHARTTAVIILDDTPSMSAAGDGGELFTQAKTAAAQVLDLLEEGDEAVLLRVSEAGSAELPAPIQSIPYLRTALTDSRMSTISRTTEDVVRAASRILAASKNFNKEIYLLSDLQEGTLESSPASPAERLFDGRTRLFTLRLKPGELRNVSVQDVRLPDIIHEPGRPVNVRVRVVNHGTQTFQNHVVSLFIDGSRVAQRGIEVPAGGTAETEFTFTASKTGILDGFAEVEDDDLEFDNRRYFTVPVPPQLRLLLAGTPADIEYVELALETRLSDSLRSILIDPVLPERLTASSLAQADVVVLVNPGLLAPGTAQALAEFVRQGGGMVLFPGPRTQPQSYQSSFGPMALPPMAGIDHASAVPGAAASFIALDKVDWQHPLFNQMFEQPSAGRAAAGKSASPARTLEPLEIRTAVRFVPGPRSSVIIAQSNGAPFLLEHTVGRGRVLLLSVSANREWSDLPTRGMFVPLLHQSVVFASRQRESHPPFVVGEPVALTLRDLPQFRVTVIDPAGGETTVPLTAAGPEKVARIPETSRPGIYKVRADGTALDAAALNIEARESDTAPADDARLERLFKRIGLEGPAVVSLTRGGSFARTVSEARFGTEFWRHLLIAALITALIELLVARDARRATAELETLSRERNV